MFNLKREKYIDNLKSLFQEFQHDCGTKHFHFKNENKENCFVISFPTNPESGNGVAHILEHLVLCGSEKFKTHDPFFAMTRRSLATFMNAMTYQDKTAYPFSTVDKKDYFNLLEVYLDATFFPKLDYYNFLQEGWRYELKEGKLSYGGVVYNEMKGAFSDKNHHIYMGIERNLKVGTPYEKESGGDPLEIPNLTYEDLKEFHRLNYHPSKATIMTFGDIDPKEIQDFFEKEVISKITNNLKRTYPEKSKINEKYKETIEYYPCENNLASEEMLLCNWLLGDVSKESINEYEVFSHILTSEGGFLCSSLENAGFGRPSDFVGVINNSYEASFHLGLEGLKKSEVEKARKFILNQIKLVAQNGVEQKIIDAGLDDLESEIKNFNSGRLPYGLSVLLSGLSFASLELDPLKGIDHEETLKSIRKKFKDSNYIKKLAQDLLDKIPLVVINFSPKKDFFEERNIKEELVLKNKFNSLSKEDISKINEESKILLDKQKNVHNYECLPKILPSDVSQNVKKDLPINFYSKSKHPTVGFINIPTNGISYVNAIFDVSSFSNEEWKWCQLLSLLLPGMKSKKDNWVVAMEKRNILCKNSEISFNALNDIEKINGGKILFEFNFFHLEEKGGNIIKLLDDFITKISFKDEKRILQIITQEISDFEQNTSTLGNMIAGQELKGNFNLLGNFQKETAGLNYIDFLKNIVKGWNNKNYQNKFIDSLTKKYKKIVNQNCIIFGAGSEATLKTLIKGQNKLKLNSASNNFDSYLMNITNKNRNLLLTAKTEINYCHAAIPVEGLNFKNESSVYLDLVAQLLTHNYLHPLIREQRGAYGANANFNILNGIFNLSTYRDPELEKTFISFSEANNWFLNKKFTEEQINEAKISLLQNLDKPTVPKLEFENTVSKFIMGITEEDRQKRKKAIIEANESDIKEAFLKFLNNKKPLFSAFTSREEKIEGFNFILKEIA